MSDEILYALSAKGSLTLDAFNRAFSELCLKGTELEENNINVKMVIRRGLRLLSAIGHCELNPETRRIVACPPSIVSLPGGSFVRAALVGARSPRLLKIINDFANKNRNDLVITRKEQSLKFLAPGKEIAVASLPDAVTIEVLDPEMLCSLGERAKINLSIDMPAAWKLANYSIGLDEYRSSLALQGRDELNWEARVFDPDSMEFKKGIEVSHDRLIEYTGRITNQKLHHLMTDDGGYLVDRDWGRYLVLSSIHRNVLLYDEKTHVMGVPFRAPLPTLLARAATMCSGQIPTPIRLTDEHDALLPKGSGIELYSGVPPEYAAMLASKLSQELIRFDLRAVSRTVGRDLD